MSKPTVAIIGASANREKFGNKSVRAHALAGYDVFPINPRGGEIEGLTAYESIAGVPVEHLNRVSLYLPPHLGLQVLEAIAAKGCDEFWLNPGSSSDEVMSLARELNLNVVQGCSIVDVGVSPSDL